VAAFVARSRAELLRRCDDGHERHRHGDGGADDGRRQLRLGRRILRQRRRSAATLRLPVDLSAGSPTFGQIAARLDSLPALGPRGGALSVDSSRSMPSSPSPISRETMNDC
jgi:hypothetical protein